MNSSLVSDAIQSSTFHDGENDQDSHDGLQFAIRAFQGLA